MDTFVYTPPGQETPRIEIRKAECQPEEGIRLAVQVYEPFAMYPASALVKSIDRIRVVMGCQNMEPEAEIRRAVQVYLERAN